MDSLTRRICRYIGYRLGRKIDILNTGDTQPIHSPVYQKQGDSKQ